MLNLLSILFKELKVSPFHVPCSPTEWSEGERQWNGKALIVGASHHPTAVLHVRILNGKVPDIHLILPCIFCSFLENRKIGCFFFIQEAAALVEEMAKMFSFLYNENLIRCY